MQLTGIHHLTAVSADAPGNRRILHGTLGMRLVKKTVNQDDVSAYHLFYADGEASPGTDLTFFDLPHRARRAAATHSIVAHRACASPAREPASGGGSASTRRRASRPARSPSATAGSRSISRIPKASGSR